MCGRYKKTTKAPQLSELFRAPFSETPASSRVRFNVAPTDVMPVVVSTAAAGGDASGDGARVVRDMRWGLVPFWSKDLTAAPRMINVRIETLHEKAAFKDSLRRRRCLVPADGFYEWKPLPGTKKKEPYLFGFDDDRPFGMAGLWATCKIGGEVIETFTIVTTAANEVVGPIHDRMPLVLEPAEHAAWLACDVDADLALFSEPRVLPGFTARRASTRVGNVKNDDASVLEAST